MALPIEAQPVPLESGADEVVRVRGSRVTLDTIVEALRDGATAEEIAQQYSSLQLADIYAVISYYLHHQSDVAAYLDQRNGERTRTREQNEARFSPAGIRERLLARQARSLAGSDATSSD